MIPCSAANLIPFNGAKPVVIPSAPVIKSTNESNISSDGFSIQSIHAKLSDIINPQKSKLKQQDEITVVDSGTCGDNVTWQLDSEGEFTIFGTGEMLDNPWLSDYSDTIKSVIIKNGVTSIKNGAFYGCNNLTSVEIPDTVTSIGNCAFYGYSALESINIPNSVKFIGGYAFAGCWALDSVVIPDSVETLGNGVFLGCSNLKSVEIPNKITSIALGTFSGCSELEYVTIPEAVTSIGESAFAGCKKLTSLTINNKITSIGDNAFAGCEALTSVTMENGVTSIGVSAFKNCSSLETVSFLGTKNPTYGNNVFLNCDNLSKINVPADYEGETFCGEPVLKWYSINYDLNGGNVKTDNPIQYNIETDTITLTNPTKVGYDFTGWTGSNGATPQMY